MTTAAEIKYLEEHGLYSSANEHDACGLGFVAHIKGEKRHDIVTQASRFSKTSTTVVRSVPTNSWVTAQVS